jgi:hypothetical protein
MRPEYAKNYIKEFLRVLRPGGLIVFQLPSEPAPLAGSALSHRKAALADTRDSIFKAQITLIRPPSALKPGAQCTLRVRVKNTSDLTWPAFHRPDDQHSIKLGNHWLHPDGATLVNDEGRAVLPHDVKPMDEIELSLTVTAPKEPGRYILEVDMAQERTGWFYEQGSDTAKVEVTVDSLRHRLSRFLDRLRDRIRLTGEPRPFVARMEMHGVAKHEVVQIIEGQGGRIVNAYEDRRVGRTWISYTYCVTK